MERIEEVDAAVTKLIAGRSYNHPIDLAAALLSWGAWIAAQAVAYQVARSGGDLTDGVDICDSLIKGVRTKFMDTFTTQYRIEVKRMQ